MYNHISFPGIGIEPFEVKKTAFSLFGVDVAWYGLLITCGMILAVLYALWMGKKKESLTGDDILDLAIYVVLFGVIGARLFYVIFEWDDYLMSSGTFLENVWSTFKNVINIRSGGLAIFGGIIGGLISAFFVAKKKKIRFLKFFDLLAPCVLIGQIIGRWGNFINMEVYGGETDSLLRMGLHHMTESGTVAYETFVQPLFLYESAWNLVGLVLIHLLFMKKKFDGQLFSTYLIWYGFGRMILEGMRNSQYNLMLGDLPVSRAVGLAALVLGIVLMIALSKKAKKQADAAVEAVAEEGSTLSLGSYGNNTDVETDIPAESTTDADADTDTDTEE